MTSSQVAAGEVAGGQLDLEYVVPARLALVAGPDSRRAGLTVNGDIVVNDSAGGVVRVHGISGHRGGLHMHAVAMINVVKVAPERSVLDAPRHTEVGLGPRRRAHDPAAARQEV